jgi:predicted metal-dependent peptidase
MAITEKELAKLKRTTLELMCQDRQKLLVRFPFTGGFLMRLELVPVRDRRLRTAATDGERVFMDLSFCAKLGADERLFVMAHEVWHCVLMHMLRCRTRNPRTFNIATDMEVNRMLSKEGLRLPLWVLVPRAGWDNLSAEEMYERLQKDHDPSPDGNGKAHGAGDGTKEGNDRAAQFDRHVYGGGTKDDETGGSDSPTIVDSWGEVGLDKDFAPSISAGLAEKIRERIVAVAQQIQRTRGTLPGHLEGVVNAALRPQIRWQEVLSQFVTSCYGGSRRWLPPSRRHLGNGLYLQSSRKERLRAVVAVDTSGSTTADLPRFFTELGSLLVTFGDYELTIIQCDCKIQHIERFDSSRPFHAPVWETFGHGGTDFRPPFDHVAGHPELEPSCLIYLTDGCGPAPDRPPSYPVLWILTNDGNRPADWGWELRLHGGESLNCIKTDHQRDF